MPTAVIAFEFDPILRLGDLALHLETLAIAGSILLALLAAASSLVRARAAGDPDGSTLRLPYRPEDLLFVALGILPGAIVGGRLGYLLLHLEFYVSQPGLVLDPTQGSLELGLAVAGGSLSGAYVASLLGGSMGGWLHVAALPALLGLGLGKLATALGGDGQGLPTDASWATAYLGPGPWGSMSPATPSHPSQIYEGLATLAILGLLLIVRRRHWFARADGRAFFAAMAWWALARAAVATTWRDAPVIGEVRAGQLVALGVAVVFVLLLATVAARGRRVALDPAAPEP